MLNTKGVIITMNSTLGVQSKEQEVRALQDCSDHQDLFSVYIRMIISHAPSVYVFINITLVIWIAQTIFSSKLNAIPTSIYLISPYFVATPFSEIKVVPSGQTCGGGLTALPIKTIPTIYSNHIFHRQLFSWDEKGVQFCVRKIAADRKGKACKEKEILCSGYCVESQEKCPITKLKISTNNVPSPGFTNIYQSNGKYYQISREEGTPIVGITVSYQPKCANDEYFRKAFNNQSQFWEKVSDCGNEGTITPIFNEVDSINTNAFFAANDLGITVTNKSLSEVYLGTINQFKFADNESKSCSDAYKEMQSVETYLEKSPVAPQFTQSLLIISFILLVLELIWLVCFYCLPGRMTQKNILAVMLSIIEFGVIGVMYNQNIELFKIQQLSKIASKCMQESVPAFKQWNFGIQSPQVFQMVLFVNTAFLGIYITALFFDYFCFQEYRRVTVHLPRLQNSHLL